MLRFGFVTFYWRDRLFEWMMTGAMLGIALHLAIWPMSIRAGSFRFMLGLITAEHLGIFFTIFGLLRAGALFANGAWPKYGPMLRVAGAGAAALIWCQMAIALFMLAPLVGIPSVGIPVYFALTLGELISAYRAISDARPAN